MAYLDCIHDRVSIIFIVFIGNTLLSGFSTYQLGSYIIVRVRAVAARQASACMRLYSFTVYIYLSAMHAYIS